MSCYPLPLDWHSFAQGARGWSVPFDRLPSLCGTLRGWRAVDRRNVQTYIRRIFQDEVFSDAEDSWHASVRKAQVELFVRTLKSELDGRWHHCKGGFPLEWSQSIPVTINLLSNVIRCSSNVVACHLIVSSWCWCLAGSLSGLEPSPRPFSKRSCHWG